MLQKGPIYRSANNILVMGLLRSKSLMLGPWVRGCIQNVWQYLIRCLDLSL